MKDALFACALTGHRALPPDFDRNALYDKLESLLQKGCGAFLCGMAQGFDLEALSCLVGLKQKYRFTIEACVPYEGYEKRLPSSARKEYEELLSWCDSKTVISPTYHKGCFLARDRYMVEHADFVLAYCTRETGGTAYTAGYAIKRDVPVVFLR